MPLTCSDSSIQLRPASGSSSIWRRSTLPATSDDVMSTSGDAPVTVMVSASEPTLSDSGSVAFWPTRNSISGMVAVPNPDSSAMTE